MKNWLVFTLLLLNSPLLELTACSYYPGGEDVRFSLFKPDLFGLDRYRIFNYNANLISDDFQHYQTYESNVYDWFNYTHKSVPIEAINLFLNTESYSDIYMESSNAFIQYLYQRNDTKAIEYLKFAKICEELNKEISGNLWELNQEVQEFQKSDLTNKLLKQLEKEEDAYFKRKYAFQTIRLNFYSNDLKSVKTLFEKYFKNAQQDYLYYWSLYFYCFTNPKEKDLHVARVFANSAEKCYAAYFYFHEGFNLERALKYSKSNKDRADALSYASIQKLGKNLDYLKMIYKYQPDSKILNHLLIREINKIEDWVFTPYYTFFMPTTYWGANSYNGKNITKLRQRSEMDRLYAKELLDFTQTVALEKVQDPELWNSAKIQLLFIIRDFGNCIKEINKHEGKKSNNLMLNNQIQKIKALCLVLHQDAGKTVVPKEIHPTIIKFKDDKLFIFALGRELEFLGNLTDGIALISTIKEEEESSPYYGSYSSVQWQGNRLNLSGHLPVFYNYFDYLDFVYSADDLKRLVSKINTEQTSEFEEIVYHQLQKDKNLLLDLLGTKYLRENQLEKCYSTFKTIDQKYWDDNYNGWERDAYSEYTFEQSPFYSFKYTVDFIPHIDKFILNKTNVIEKLIEYTSLANEPNSKDRDLYAFLVANCYYNMGQNGNSWIMRRFNSSDHLSGDNLFESYIDEHEYRRSNLAISFYRKAYNYSSSKKFKALCLRMIDYVNYNNGINSNNLKNTYPEYVSDLSTCENLGKYFESR